MGQAGTGRETVRRLQNVDPYEFEHFVGDLWEQDGWQTTVSQGSQDLGLDVEAVRTGTIDQKLAIQAKRYADDNKVGRPKVQRYHSLKQQDTDADAAVVVTTSTFTDTAEDWAGEHNVKLVDGSDLVDMIDRLGAHGLVDEYAPPASEIEGEAAADTTSGSESADTSASETSSESEPRKWLSYLFVGLLVQISGFVIAGVPSIIPSAPDQVLVGAALIGVVASPFLMGLDAHAQHKAGASYQPNRLFWPFTAFALPVITVAVYLWRREKR